MTDDPTGTSAAARLLRALEANTPVGAHVRDLLPELAEAEAAGVDIDSDPRYAEALEHLDSCSACMALYAELAEALESQLHPGEAPAALPAPPSFFTASRQSQIGATALQVLGSLRRAFQLDLRVQMPALGVLSGGQAASLFADNVPELAGAPVLSVALAPSAAGTSELLVAVLEQAGSTPWEVRIDTPVGSRTAITDAHGLARFAGVSLADGAPLRVSGRALPAPNTAG